MCLDLIERTTDDPWLIDVLRDGGPKPTDAGVYWFVTESDDVYPGRVFVASRGPERHQVMLTFVHRLARVIVLHDPLNDWQAGDTGRSALRSGRDVPAGP